MLLHHIDSNSFWVEPLKNQTEGLLIVAWTQALEQMRKQGIVPKHQILDNPCYARMKLAMESTTLLDGLVSKMMYKLVPPEDHQRSLAKKLIGTFKGHFIRVLSGCAKSKPMHLWCQLLPQVEQQLLLLRQSWVNPGMSAYAYVYQGQHDYNKHPFVPIRMELLVHIKLHKQQTYAQHCNKGYIIGTMFETTNAKRSGWRTCTPHEYQGRYGSSTIRPEDQIVAAIGRLAKTLTTGVPPQLRNNVVDTLCKLQEIIEPRTDGKDEHKITAPTQQAPIPQQSPRLAESNNHDPAAFPRVAQEYDMLPRVLEKMGMDTMDRSSPQ